MIYIQFLLMLKTMAWARMDIIIQNPIVELLKNYHIF